MTQPQLPDSAVTWFRELERRLQQVEMLKSTAPVPHGATLPDAGERANQLFVQEGTPYTLHYSDGTTWHAL